jgi:hypothetical protein
MGGRRSPRSHQRWKNPLTPSSDRVDFGSTDTPARTAKKFGPGFSHRARNLLRNLERTKGKKVNLTASPTDRETDRKIVCRACKLAHVACDTECPNCGFWCSPSCYETFWKMDESERQAVNRRRAWKLLASLALGTTVAILGWAQIGAMFWLLEVVAFVFIGFIPALLLL